MTVRTPDKTARTASYRDRALTRPPLFYSSFPGVFGVVKWQLHLFTSSGRGSPLVMPCPARFLLPAFLWDSRGADVLRSKDIYFAGVHADSEIRNQYVGIPSAGCVRESGEGTPLDSASSYAAYCGARSPSSERRHPYR